MAAFRMAEQALWSIPDVCLRAGDQMGSSSLGA